MSQICIDASVLGTSKHFIIEDGFRWSDSVPRGSWHLSGDLKTSPTAKCLDTLMRLVNNPPPQLPPQFIKAMSTLVTGSHEGHIMWQHVVPQGVFQNYFKNIVRETSSLFPTLPLDYYETVWAAGSRLLGSLKPAKVDPARWAQLAETQQNSQVIESFRPGKTGYARQVTYNRFGTRTGRLTVEDGPGILTLKKDNRDMLRSSFPGGCVCSLDFRALEVRIVLAEAGTASSHDDIYDDIATSQFGGAIPRDVVKVAVISELYGISRSALVARLQVSDSKVDAFINVIRQHFKLAELRARLKEELHTNGRLRSRFGRPLFLDEGHDNLLINTYAQASGVDVAMLGFDSVVRQLGSEGVRPLFILHDALILDVHPDKLNEVQDVSSVAVPTYESRFPLKFEKI